MRALKQGMMDSRAQYSRGRRQSDCAPRHHHDRTDSRGSRPNRRDGRQTFKFGLTPKKMSMVFLHPGLEQRNYERQIRDCK